MAPASLTVAGCLVQRGPGVLALGEHVRPFGDEELGHPHHALFGRPVERRQAQVTRSTDRLGALLPGRDMREREGGQKSAENPDYSRL